MAWTQDAIDVVKEALFFLRQDVELPTPETAESETSLEWNKATLAYKSAMKEIISAHDWTFMRSGDKENLSKWPGDLRGALVSLVARELALPLAGRRGDLELADAVYRDRLHRAMIHDLEDEVAGDETAAEVLATIRQYYGDDSKLPRSILSLAKRIEAIEDSCYDELMAAHAWSGSDTGVYGFILSYLKGV